MVLCYHIKDILETDEQYLLNAQTFLFECQKSDVKDIKNISKLYLGILNGDNQDAFNDYARGLKFDNETWNDLYILIQTFPDLDKKPRSAIQALNNLKERKNLPEPQINFYLVLAYWNAKQKNKAKKLLTKIKREDFSNNFHICPVFDLVCCVILNSSEAKDHLKELVERYPDTERFYKILESAEKENLDAIKGELIEILIPSSFNNYSIITSNKIKVPSYRIDHDSQIKLKDRSEQADEKGEYKNHLILIPKYKAGNKCQNTFQWYDENGALKEGRLTDDLFDLIYYVAWLDLSESKIKKENLYFSKNVTDEHIVEIMGKKKSLGPKARFNSKWAKDDKSGRLKGQRMSDINNKIGKEIISRPETSLIINKNITVDLKPFP